jgi:hypothetical protein
MTTAVNEARPQAAFQHDQDEAAANPKTTQGQQAISTND